MSCGGLLRRPSGRYVGPCSPACPVSVSGDSSSVRVVLRGRPAQTWWSCRGGLVGGVFAREKVDLSLHVVARVPLEEGFARAVLAAPHLCLRPFVEVWIESTAFLVFLRLSARPRRRFGLETRLAR